MSYLALFYGIIGAIAGYGLGYHDGRWSKPPPPLKGTYEHTEEKTRVDDYPENWT